jgi:hypothetical protein
VAPSGTVGNRSLSPSSAPTAAPTAAPSTAPTRASALDRLPFGIEFNSTDCTFTGTLTSNALGQNFITISAFVNVTVNLQTPERTFAVVNFVIYPALEVSLVSDRILCQLGLVTISQNSNVLEMTPIPTPF